MDVDVSKIRPGDKIAVSGQWEITLKEVLKITPTGRIKLMNGDTYDKKGRLIGEHYYHSHIVPMEAYEAEKRRKEEDTKKREILNKITNIGTKLTIDQLQRILKIYEE
ncbi:MAG: hypothetical protein WC720_05420 [Candidatus Shapirobacteria bacterium]|jgi:hypothetical protein